jgi:hypothetical protein
MTYPPIHPYSCKNRLRNCSRRSVAAEVSLVKQGFLLADIWMGGKGCYYLIVRAAVVVVDKDIGDFVDRTAVVAAAGVAVVVVVGAAAAVAAAAVVAAAADVDVVAAADVVAVAASVAVAFGSEVGKVVAAAVAE